jgi:LacI family transcriptional regulator
VIDVTGADKGRGRTRIPVNTTPATPSIKDVAAAARVSVGTVSNVLNHPEIVAEPTRERVLGVIARLGFVRNETARHLRARSSRVIGLIVLDASNPFEMGVAAGVADAAEAAGCALMLGSSAGSLERERRYVNLFEEQRVRGLLVTPTHLGPPNVSGLTRRGIPVVFLDGHPDRTYSSVAIDDVAGSRIAVEHLLSRGHQRLALVGGPFTLAQMQDRSTGAEEAVRRHGGDASILTVSTPNLTLHAGIAAAEQILVMTPEERPTALFAANDLVALGLLQRLLAAGVKVPDDMALVGYDDIEFAAFAPCRSLPSAHPARSSGRRRPSSSSKRFVPVRPARKSGPGTCGSNPSS